MDGARNTRSGNVFYADQPAFALTMDRYVESHPRSAILNGVVVCYYEMHTPDHEVAAIPIIPDASVDLLWVDDGADVDTFVTVPAASLVGLRSHGPRRVLGVRLVPGAISRLMNIAVGSIGAHQVSLRQVIPTRLPTGERIHSLTFPEFIAEIEQSLADALRNSRDRPITTRQSLMHHCVARMLESGGDVGVNTLAKETGFSERYINATFHLYTGLSPKQLGQVSRLQRVIAHLSDGRHRTLSTVSQMSGYYDQSHMNRTLRSLVQTTASQLGGHDFFTPTSGRQLPIAFHF